MAQVFEFHFNPPKEITRFYGEELESIPNLIFDSFCYEPKDIYERRLGSLYIVGLLKNVLPKNINFLEKLSKFIQERYYRKTLLKPEKSLRETLKETNEFLAEIVKNGDVSWLGNLNFVVLNLKNFVLNFTKVGEMKIYLIRGEKIIDIDKRVKFQDIEPYPLKIFGNVVSGKLAENDLILVLTKEIFDFFQNENLFSEIGKLEQYNEESFKRILDKKKEILTQISGICLIIVLTKDDFKGKKETITFQSLKEFSLKEVFASLFAPILTFLKKFKKSKIKTLKLPFEVLKSPPTKIFLTSSKSLISNKKIILVLVLILVLLFGFIFSQIEQNRKIKIFQNQLKEIEKNLNLAQSYLILKTPPAEKKANQLLKQNWEQVSLILKESKNLPKDLNNQLSLLKKEILKNLSDLNKLEKIDLPELVFEFNSLERIGKDFVPQKIIVVDNNLYFFSPGTKNLFLLKEDGKTEIIETNQKINLATGFNSKILLFSKPNELIILNGEKRFVFNIKEPYPDFSFDDLFVFERNLYFFDKKTGQIIRYLYDGNFKWKGPKLWLKKPVKGKSITVDASIWILENNNSIGRYRIGNLQEKIELDIFPSVKDFSKIFTSPLLPYLYILEPIQKRIIVLSKKGEIVKQFQSEKFDNLLDFSVSKDGKEIYLLNGLKVYKITLN